MTTNIDLLRLEMKTLWERDAYGRLRPEPLVAIASANDGVAERFSSVLGSELRKELDEVSVGDSSPEAILERYRSIVEPVVAAAVRGGPSYVFPQEEIVVGATDLQISTSEGSSSTVLTVGRPEAWWEMEEWEDLLSGRLGPWAIGTFEDTVAAICHTPVGSSLAAEAGVWTHPDFRRRGYAVEVTTAWAGVARKQFGTLFYSTGSENFASQGVAQKLGLRPIGWIWQLEARRTSS